MSTRYRILPYKQASGSAKALAAALGGKVLKLAGSAFTAKPDDVVINWGNTTYIGLHDDWNVLNTPYAICLASNKKLFFQEMEAKGLSDVIPRFWTSKSEVPDDCYPVVCRTVLAGHSGAGVVIARTPAELVDCSLYVKYEKKKDEYRIHVGRRITDGTAGYEAFSIQRKARRLDTPPSEVNWQIRNHSTGFIYRRDGVVPPAAVIDGAKRALEASRLDFGAVDVIWNAQLGKAFVLEINTAPGLEGQTIQDYADFFKGFAS